MSKNFLSPLRIEVLCLTRVEFTAEEEIPDTYDASFTLTTIPQPLRRPQRTTRRSGASMCP